MKLDVNSECIKSVFIVGMNGSGTSMLNESLGRHPELYSFPGETRMIPHLINQAPRFGDLRNDKDFLSFWEYVISSSPDFEVFNNHRTLEVPDNWREFDRDLATILDAVFRQFALRQGKKRWCEKSPNNSECILRIAELFPDSRFVHIIRDGRDCAASTQRRQRRNPELTIYRWRQVVSEARRQGNQIPDRYFEVQYERLTQDPERWMREICEFLGVDFDLRVLQSAMPQSGKRATKSASYVGKIEPNSEKFLQSFDVKEIKRLERISGEMLRELGYMTYYTTGSEEIGRLKSKVIRLIEFFKANRGLRDKLSGKPGMTWRKVFRSTLASIREYYSKKY